MTATITRRRKTARRTEPRSTANVHLPAGPLCAYARTLATVGAANLDEEPHPGPPSDADVAVVLGISTDVYGQLRRRDWVTARTADRLAVALGLHPANIWPDWYDRLNAVDE